MGIVIKDFVEKITLEKVEERVNFNQISESDFVEFKTNFLNENEENKVIFLTKIIEETDETDLLEGNFKIFFEDDVVKDLLKKCL
jgi:hypothetical protein